MKKFSWAAAALLLALIAVLGLGCSTDKGSTPPNTGNVASVQIVMFADTLNFLPGDSATADGWVVVTDNQSRAMQGIVVELSLLTPVGYLEYPYATRDTTDSEGRVWFRYRSWNQTGETTIRAAVGNVVDLKHLWIRQKNDVVAHLELNVDRNHLTVAPGAEDSVQVSVTISDSAYRAVRGMILPVRANGGRLKPIGQTDSTGRAVTTWYSNGQFGTFTISCTIGEQSASRDIRVDSLINSFGTLEIKARDRVISADNCITLDTLSVVLKDEYNVAVPNAQVYLSASFGLIAAADTTDGQGEFLTTFCSRDRASADPLDSAMIIARYPARGLADTAYVFVTPPQNIGSVNVTINPNRGTAGVDSIHVMVNAFYADGSRITGRDVIFHSSCGFANFAPALMTLQDGHAEALFKLCNETTVDTLPAEVWATVEMVESNHSQIDIFPGLPTQVEINTDASFTTVNGELNVWADVFDSLDNRAGAGIPVLFTTDIGAIQPPLVATDSHGRAMAVFHPGTAAGNASIKATMGPYVDSTLVLVLAGNTSSIQLSTSNTAIQVAGFGGITYTQLIADVRDANGNAVPDGRWVTFEIIDEPRDENNEPCGCNINLHGSIDSSSTAGGIAMVTLNAGTCQGSVIVEARTIGTTPDDTLTYSARISNINVVAGPPEFIDVQVINTANDGGTGEASWDLPVVAMVSDHYGNPVRDGWAVFFSVESGPGQDTCSILSDTVYTGNGLHNQGVAYSTLRYISAATYETVFITAATGGENGVSETIAFVLPLQDPSISLNCMPATWHFNADGSIAQIKCQSIVRDGHGVLINGATVIYSTTRGRFYPQNSSQNQTSWRRTGPVYSGDPNIPNGYTWLWLRETQDYIFPDAQSPEITGDVQVEVEGYPDAIDSQTINYRRIPQ